MPGLATNHRVELVSADRRQCLLWVALAVAVVVIAWLIMELYSPAPLAAPEVAMQDAELTRQNFETVEEVADPQQLNNELAVVAPVVEATDSVIETASDLGDAGTDVVQEFPAVKAPAATVTSSSAVKQSSSPVYSLAIRGSSLGRSSQT